LSLEFPQARGVRKGWGICNDEQTGGEKKTIPEKGNKITDRGGTFEAASYDPKGEIEEKEWG